MKPSIFHLPPPLHQGPRMCRSHKWEPCPVSIVRLLFARGAAALEAGQGQGEKASRVSERTERA